MKGSWLRTQKIHSNVAPLGRRQLLLGGSVAALAAAAGATVRSALAGEPDETPAPTPAADVRQFGAVGDGSHDDSDALAGAIEHAARNRLPCVLLPAGTFLVSSRGSGHPKPRRFSRPIPLA